MNKNYTITKRPLHSKTEIKAKNDYLIIINNSSSFSLSIHNKDYICNANDLVLLKPNQKTMLYPIEDKIIDIFTVSLSEKALETYSDETLNFLEKFDFVPYEIALVHSTTDTVLLLKNILNRTLSLEKETMRFGLEFYEKSLISAFLVTFLRSCITSDSVHQQNQKKDLSINEVFMFIRNHITEDLSIERLQAEFFVSGEHICRKFKKDVGISLHQYIIKRRIDLSKKYILDGFAISEIYSLCGFNSYTHFFKAFKKQTKLTPLEYRKQNSNHLSTQ